MGWITRAHAGRDSKTDGVRFIQFFKSGFDLGYGDQLDLGDGFLGTLGIMLGLRLEWPNPLW
jgi:hypothetical protein